jgi:hypothetical protein
MYDLFWFLDFFFGTGMHISWNTVWQTLLNTNMTSPANCNKETKAPLLTYDTRKDEGLKSVRKMKENNTLKRKCVPNHRI